MILQAVEKCGERNVLFILGSEIPLETLCITFKTIYLFDIHPDQCYAALKRKRLDDNPQIHVVYCDLSFAISRFFDDQIKEFILVPNIKSDMIISSLLVSQISKECSSPDLERNALPEQSAVDQLILTEAQALIHAKMLVEQNPRTIYYADTPGPESEYSRESILFARIKTYLGEHYLMDSEDKWLFQYTNRPTMTTVAAVIFVRRADESEK